MQLYEQYRPRSWPQVIGQDKIVRKIDRLRKRGLAGGQVAELILYTMPWMLSLTMPIAALFAATIVYGRFSMDNEMTACRASGVSTLNVLLPALMLGAIVTVLSLGLSNYVVPSMLEMLSRSVKDNAMAIVGHRLDSQGYFKQGTRVIHADAVSRHKEGLTLYGVVA
ncbi:hypothetical protein LCGC14_2140620, partial [marine sediment metagenome]